MSNESEVKEAHKVLSKLAQKRLSRLVKPRMKLMEENLKDDSPLTYKTLQAALMGKETYDKVKDFQEGNFSEDITLHKDKNSKTKLNLNRTPSGYGAGLNYQYKGDWDKHLEDWFNKDTDKDEE